MAPTRIPMRIVADPTRVIWQIPKGLRGFNFWGTRSDAPFFPEYQAIGLDLLRFPPGRTGDENNLSATLMDEAGAVARGVGAELVVEVRLRGGIPEVAAENVRYMNQRKGFGARYWEVGNEPDIYGRRAGEPDFSPQWYAEQFRLFALAMKAADPTIQIFGPVLSNKLDQWMPPFIRECGDVIDGLSWHFYGGNGAKPEAELLASTAEFDRQVAKVRGWWADRALNPLGANRRVPLLISEYGASYQTDVPTNLTTLAAALWTADMFGRLVQNRIDLAAYFALWGLGFHGVWDRRGNRRPVHTTFRLLHEFGDQVVPIEGDQPLVASYAAMRADGNLSLLLINKSPDQSYQAQIDLNGAQVVGPTLLYRQAKEIDGVALPPIAPSGLLALELPPYSTTVALLPIARMAAPPLIWGGVAAMAGSLAIGAAANLIRRRSRRQG